MKQISILLSYVFNDYSKTCKLLGVPSSNYNTVISAAEDSTFVLLLIILFSL